MSERYGNPPSLGVVVEFDYNQDDRSGAGEIIFEHNCAAAKRRKENRERVEREWNTPLASALAEDRGHRKGLLEPKRLLVRRIRQR